MALDAIRSFFSRRIDPASGGTPPDRVAIAACALLLELAHADDSFSDEERARIVRAAHEMGVADGDLEELLRLAEQERRGSVDLFGFTREIAERYSREERLRLVEAIWGVVYSDGSLTEAENRLARRIAEMLGFQHPEVQAAKERVASRRP
ncbi:MAG TPA: TerB family tellurite resistance protein [Thermoanaerobaculia bacterium]